MVGVNHHILQQDDEAAAGGGDREEQVHHAEDSIVVANDENAAAVRLFQNEAQAPFLRLAIRTEVLGAGEQVHHQLREGRKILQGGGFDTWRINQNAGLELLRGRVHGKSDATNMPSGHGFLHLSKI